MILLDTNALIWLRQGHRRSRPLFGLTGRLFISPISLLELQLLLEARRIDLRGGVVADLIEDDRWLLDDPPSAGWFGRALDVGWTRDPFDRLLVAHAGLRGWRVATSDGALIDRLGPRGTLEL